MSNQSNVPLKRKASAPLERPDDQTKKLAVADAAKRAALISARLAQGKASGNNQAQNGASAVLTASPGVAGKKEDSSSHPASAPPSATSAASKLAEMKARIAARTGQRPEIRSPVNENAVASPDGVGTDGGTPIESSVQENDRLVKERRPAIMPSSGLPNKYLPVEDAKLKPTRRPRQLVLTHHEGNLPALEAAEERRNREQLENMRKMFQSRRQAAARVEGGIDVTVYIEPAPPETERWDVDLLDANGEVNTTLVTDLVLYPVLPQPVQNIINQQPQARIYLTKAEMEKKRRIKRKAEHKETQDRIRLGIDPPPPPKLHHNNFMKVFPQLSVRDPTRMEALVNRQIQERLNKHEEDNNARALTKEQRLEKIKNNAEKNAAAGIEHSVYKINLTKDQLHKKHKYLIGKNIEEYHDVTGLCLATPSATILIIEGGIYSTKKLHHLLINRIHWQEIMLGNGSARDGQEKIFQEMKKDIYERDWDTHLAVTEWMDSQVEKGHVVYTDKTCQLIWRGNYASRKFRKWGGIRDFESDEAAKELLVKANLKNLWTVLRIVPPEQQQRPVRPTRG